MTKFKRPVPSFLLLSGSAVLLLQTTYIARSAPLLPHPHRLSTCMEPVTPQIDFEIANDTSDSIDKVYHRSPSNSLYPQWVGDLLEAPIGANQHTDGKLMITAIEGETIDLKFSVKGEAYTFSGLNLFDVESIAFSRDKGIASIQIQPQGEKRQEDAFPHVTFHNETGTEINEVYLAEVDSTKWFADQTGKETIADTDDYCLRPHGKGTLYNLKVVLKGGKNATFRNLDISGNTDVTAQMSKGRVVFKTG